MAKTLVLLCLLTICAVLCHAALPHTITIDGSFDDWQGLPIYSDPADKQDGSVLQDGIPDVHDTDHKQKCDVPAHVYNPDADLINYAFTHDDGNFYAYLKATGNMSRSGIHNTTAPYPGRSYIQIVIDVDNDMDTGYYLNEGGYFPTSRGWDMHFELELFNGTFNTAHYLLHAMNDNSSYHQQLALNKEGLMSLDIIDGLATYKPYTEWVLYDATGANAMSPRETANCKLYGDGPYTLPNGDQICFVEDKIAGGPYKGIMEFAFSEDGTAVEIKAPWKGFLQYTNKTSPINIGQTIHINFCLEVSGEFSVPQNTWATDCSWPIRGYLIEAAPPAPFEGVQMSVLGFVFSIIGAVSGSALIAFVITFFCMRNRAGYKKL